VQVILRSPTSSRPASVQESILGRGGEGSIYRVEPGVVLKKYHDMVLKTRGSELEDKINLMLLRQPTSHDLCWPQSAAYENDVFVGYTMPEVDVAHTLAWSALANVASRRVQAAQFGVAHAIRACVNGAAALNAAHMIGVVLGDVNESNILVQADARVVVVDCDSAQVPGPDHIAMCLVGKADYCAPELVGQNFRDTVRSPASDIFAFGVLVFQMLTGGAHPFDGVGLDTSRDLDPMQDRIRNGLTPYFNPQALGVLSAPSRVAFEAIDLAIRELLGASLHPNPGTRPSAAQWHSVLSVVDSELVECRVVPTHAYNRRLAKCPWCAHLAKEGTDPFGPAALSQVGTTPIDFSPGARLVRPSLGGSGPGAGQVSRQVSGGYSTSSVPGGYSASSVPGGGPGPDEYVGSSWFDVALRHPGAVTTHLVVKHPVLERLVAVPPRKTSSLWSFLGVSLGTVLAWWVVCWGVVWVVSRHSGASSTRHVALSDALVGVVLVSMVCSAVLIVVWLVGNKKLYGGLKGLLDKSNALRLGICGGPGGVLAALALIMWGMTSVGRWALERVRRY
jgi:hypothetical protein